MNQYKADNSSLQTIMILFASVTLLFLFRSLWTFPLDHSDAIQKYFYAGEILRSGDWSLLLHNHHTLRWAAMLPQIGLTWMLGIRYEVFYILPLLIYSLYVVLIIFSLRNVFNLSQQLLLLAFLLSEPLSLHISNQYLVTGLGTFFIFAGILVLVTPVKRSNLAVVLAGLFFFIAYGAHVTYLSFAAGGFLWLLLFQRKPSRAIIFCATILTLFIIETLTFNYLSDWQFVLGRLEALASSPHVGRTLDYDPVTFSQLFTRWLMLPVPHLLLCLSLFLAIPLLIVRKKRGQEVPAFIECSLLVALCFGFAITFALQSIDPIRPVQPLLVRYLIPILPFASIMTVFVLSCLVSEYSSKLFPRAEVIISTVVVVVLLLVPPFTLDFVNSKFNAFMWKADEQYTEFAEMFRDGELKLTGKQKIVQSMIARFKYPAKIKNGKSGLSVIELSPEALCASELRQVPLRLNYKKCVE